MDDLISRAAAIECAIDAVDDWGGGWNPNRKTVIRKYFEELPAVDAVPVIRCRDCKHRPTDNRDSDDMTGFAIEFPDGKCPCQCEDGWYNWYPGDDWFCADGERRDDDALSGR